MNCLWWNGLIKTEIDVSTIKCSDLNWSWQKSIFQRHFVSENKIIAFSNIWQVTRFIIILKREMNIEATLMVRISFVSFWWKIKYCICVKACFHFNCECFFLLAYCLTIWHNYVSYVIESFKGTVVKFINGAGQGNFDIFWWIWVTRIISFAWNFLKIKSVNKWTLCAKKGFKDLKAFTTVGIATSCNFLSTWLHKIFKSIRSIFIIYGFQFVIW